MVKFYESPAIFNVMAFQDRVLMGSGTFQSNDLVNDNSDSETPWGQF